MPEEYLNSKQACRYLAEKWGMESYSEDSFRALVRLRGISPDIGEGREAKRWKTSTLDLLYKPSKSNPRKSAPKRRRGKEHTDGDDMTNPSVVLSTLCPVPSSPLAHFMIAG